MNNRTALIELPGREEEWAEADADAGDAEGDVKAGRGQKAPFDGESMK